jgi:hypothetical protein
VSWEWFRIRDGNNKEEECDRSHDGANRFDGHRLRCDPDDDVIIVGIVVDPVDPRLIKRIRMGERNKSEQHDDQEVRIHVPTLGTTDEALAGSTGRPNQEYRDPPSCGRITLDDPR